MAKEDGDRAVASSTFGEIEVTAEMIEVGVRVYLEHCPDSGVGDRLDRKMIAEIFAGMTAARPADPST